MKHIIFLLISFGFLLSCSTVKMYDNRLDEPRNENRLRSDVDFIHHKLVQLHPHLYWYISKKDLDFKFDSLKSSITSPMSSKDFFLALSPVISSVKQGHIQVIPPIDKATFEEVVAGDGKSFSDLFPFDFEIFDQKLYIVKNKSKDPDIHVGTEVLALNHTNPQMLFSKYCNTFSSDGFNRTFINRKLGSEFSEYFMIENGKTDSITYQLKYDDTISNICIRYEKPQPSKANYPKQDKEKRKEEVKKNKQLGFDASSNSYNLNLKFYEPDSSVALMTIRNFTSGNFSSFFDYAFRKLEFLDSKYLILDLRDNPGGNLGSAAQLFSYLVDGPYRLIDEMEVTSRTSILHTPYFKLVPVYARPILALFFLVRLEDMVIDFFKVEKKENEKYFLHSNLSKIGFPRENRFKGKVYVMINGGSFSASCILSSNLKSFQRATFVGEETGGAYNGCVSGKFAVYGLPNSNLIVAFGLTLVQPFFKSDVDGRGIFPDQEIIPTLEDRKNGNDPELNWIMADIKGLHAVSGQRP